MNVTDLKHGTGNSLPAPFAWIDIPDKGYSIAKYPLTNAQYAKFMDAGGYDQRQWWMEAGWEAKRSGLAHDWGKGTEAPTDVPWTTPRYWHDSQWNGAEYPVVGVTWYEAAAFCQWLSSVTNEHITLPSEEQWQYAAQGDDGRKYPWGDTWDCTRCNNSVKPCHSDGTTPVRQYEGNGDSPFGAVDMAGNVWEWCLTDFENKTNDIMSNANTRVVRGGGWFYFSTADCRCNFRYADAPYGCYNFRGFRIARINSKLAESFVIRPQCGMGYGMSPVPSHYNAPMHFDTSVNYVTCEESSCLILFSHEHTMELFVHWLMSFAL